MLTVGRFEEWLRVFRFTGTVHYGSTTWTVDHSDVDSFIDRCRTNPHLTQELLDQGHCDEEREAMAYLKYLEQAGKTYVMVL
jgi:hypothetical protein